MSVLRSLLFVPGDAPRKFEKALASGADGLILDLEDSVAASVKATARREVADFLRTGANRDGPRLYVRVNALDSGLADDDLAAIMGAAPAGIMLPKCASGADAQRLGARLAVREAERGLRDGATEILPLVTETAASLFAMGTYAGASPRLRAMTWGAEDLSADLGAEDSRGDDGELTFPYRMARALMLFCAAAARLMAIDTIFADFRDSAGLARECEAARRDGFCGKLAIHPAQVAVINEAFTPSPAAIAEARRVVAAFEMNPDAGVAALDGRMIDRPHARRAERILARAGLSHPSGE